MNIENQVYLSLLCLGCISIIIVSKHEQGFDHHYKPNQQESSVSINKPVSNEHDLIDQHNPSSLPIICDKPKDRVITVRNKITKKMITYTKGFMQYAPDFVITINDTPINQGEEQTVAIKNDRLIAGYSYNFMSGYKKGTKVIEFILSPAQHEFDITFSWQDDWRLAISEAKPDKIISQS